MIKSENIKLSSIHAQKLFERNFHYPQSFEINDEDVYIGHA